MREDKNWWYCAKDLPLKVSLLLSNIWFVQISWVLHMWIVSAQV